MKDVLFTSEQLHKNHAAVYDTFFANHAIIVSVPLTIRWASVGIMQKDTIPTIMSKLPLRCYVGIQPVATSGVSMSEIISYDFGKGQYRTFAPQDRDDRLDAFCALLSEKKSGWSLSVLIESEQYTGTGSFAALALCCAYRLHDYHDDEHLLLETTKMLENVFKGENTSSDRALTMVQQGSLLLVDGSAYKPLEYDHLPVDIAVVYSGVPGDTRWVKQSKKIYQNKLHAYDQLINHLFGRFTGNENLPRLTTHVGPLIEALQAVFTAQMVEYIDAGMPVQDITPLVLTQELITHIFSYTHHDDRFIDVLHDTELQIGVLPLFHGVAGGSYLVCMPYGLRRANMTEKIELIREQYPQLTVLWKSREQTHEHGACIKIEQNLLENERSEWTKDDAFMYENNQGIKEVGNAQELRTKRKDTGLFCDAIERKMYANGEKLTSKHFESQTTTIEIIERCFAQLGKPIVNTDLSYSTLTRQYNQFLGKIIAPLKKVCREYFNHDLMIETHGTLREFTVQINEKKLCIGVLKKI